MNEYIVQGYYLQTTGKRVWLDKYFYGNKSFPNLEKARKYQKQFDSLINPNSKAVHHPNMSRIILRVTTVHERVIE